MKKRIHLALIGLSALGLNACLTESSTSVDPQGASSMVQISSSSNDLLSSDPANLSEENTQSSHEVSLAFSSDQDIAHSSDIDLISSEQLSLSSNQVQSSSSHDVEPATRVVSYIPLYRNQDDMYSNIDLSVTTHVNVSFVNPDDDSGDFLGFSYSGQWTAFKRHHQTLIDKNIKVIASIGGGAAPKSDYLTLMQPSNKTSFISKLMDFTRENKLDGIDVDLEGDLVNSSLYNPFVLELADSVKAEGLIYSAAVAMWNGNKISDASLESFDFINLMAYDATGPWSPTQVKNHSSMDFAQENLDYWAGKRGVAKDKVVLGVPFYGYKFTTSGVSAFTWDQYLTSFPGSIEEDQVGTQNTAEGIWFCNGRKTMKDKVLLANNYGGIMIWELGQDTYDDTSLMKVIVDHIQK
jgi:chitinase